MQLACTWRADGKTSSFGGGFGGRLFISFARCSPNLLRLSWHTHKATCLLVSRNVLHEFMSTNSHAIWTEHSQTHTHTAEYSTACCNWGVWKVCLAAINESIRTCIVIEAYYLWHLSMWLPVHAQIIAANDGNNETDILYTHCLYIFCDFPKQWTHTHTHTRSNATVVFDPKKWRKAQTHTQTYEPEYFASQCGRQCWITLLGSRQLNNIIPKEVTLLLLSRWLQIVRCIYMCAIVWVVWATQRLRMKRYGCDLIGDSIE